MGCNSAGVCIILTVSVHSNRFQGTVGKRLERLSLALKISDTVKLG